jgi:hypothetical protein
MAPIQWHFLFWGESRWKEEILALAQTQRKERRADNGKEVAFGAE